MKRAEMHSKSACAQAQRLVRTNEGQRCIRIVRDELRGVVSAGDLPRSMLDRIVERILDSKDAALTKGVSR